MRILVVNAGSSSLKLRVLDEGDTVAGSRDLPAPRGRVGERAVSKVIATLGAIDAVGHRIVHGGAEFNRPVLIDGKVEERLRALVDLAPLHQPGSLAALAAVKAVLPSLPAVACFDTAFHARMPAAAATYALPWEWRKRWDLRRFGFHGLSHAYASRRVAELLGRPPEELRVVTCHLGAGATLEHRSGLLALAGTADMRAVLEAAGAGETDARLAVDVYVHRLRAAVASMAAAMNGLDSLVFTGGVGENAPAVRERASEGLAFLGVKVDPERNVAARADGEIGAEGAPVRTFVITAREDVQIAREVRRVLMEGGEGAVTGG